MKDGFDIDELDKFDQKMLTLANDTLPSESRKFLNKEGSKLNKTMKSVYKGKGIGEDSGRLKKGFKKGRVYKYKGKDLSIRAYNNAPHAHLLNDGWLHKARDGSERWVLGFKFIDEADKKFRGNYWDDCREFIDDLIRKGL